MLILEFKNTQWKCKSKVDIKKLKAGLQPFFFEGNEETANQEKNNGEIG